jgi:hypothetical protein
MAQTPVQYYLPKLMRLIEEGSIDPSFVFLADRVGWRVNVRALRTRERPSDDFAPYEFASDRLSSGSSGWSQ